MIRSVIAALILCTAASAQELIWVQCGPQGCCPPPGYYFQNPRPRQQPDRTPPVGSQGTPDFCPRPPSKPTLPPQPDQVLPTPQPNACNCAEKWVKIEALIAEIKSISGKAGPQGKQGDVGPQGERGAPGAPGASPTIDYEKLAAELSKKLTHSATITLLDGTKKTQTKPLSEPLEFIQHPRDVR